MASTFVSKSNCLGSSPGVPADRCVRGKIVKTQNPVNGLAAALRVTGSIPVTMIDTLTSWAFRTHERDELVKVQHERPL